MLAPSNAKFLWVKEDRFRGPAHVKTVKLSQIIYGMCTSRFGVAESRTEPKPSWPRRRQHEISIIRARLRDLERQLKNANETGK